MPTTTRYLLGGDAPAYRNNYGSTSGSVPSYGSNNQQNVYNWATQMVNQQSQLQQQANRQIESRQRASENMYAGMINQYQGDPMFRQLRSQISNWMENPGLSPSTMRKLEAQARARSAADTASNQRSMQAQTARLGLSGAQTANLNAGVRSAGGASLNNALTNLALQGEQMAQQGWSGAISAGQNLAGNYYGNLGQLAGAYSGVMQSYNPQVAPLNVYDLMASAYQTPSYGSNSYSFNPYENYF